MNTHVVVKGEEKVNIGLPVMQSSRGIAVKERKQVIKNNKRNPEMERAARLRTCKFLYIQIFFFYLT